MTYYLAELYSPRPAWLALDQASRGEFFETVGAGMAPLIARGIEPLASGEVESTALHSASQQFFALWRAPDQASMDALLSAIADTGWHEYFETINATGVGGDLNRHLGQLAAA
ncbi:DUF6616 family protein [Shinella sedimenti]|uniref:Uncharacterized protein n=1 Tax=Shinella sedimenti TaxID=2919913 RepID=A0ABT0CNX6_9HYPH|nr:DUF6616 family protein [Shinella sedimenti]MCJ8150285.1 hypothetical protein [Shinella sedimenti]